MDKRADEQHLIGRFVAGDEQAFAAVIERYHDDAVRHAQGLLGNRDEALDAAQEAFIDAYTQREKLRDHGAFRAWLRAIVRTRALRGRRGRPSEPLLDEPEAALPTPE